MARSAAPACTEMSGQITPASVADGCGSGSELTSTDLQNRGTTGFGAEVGLLFCRITIGVFTGKNTDPITEFYSIFHSKCGY